MAPPTTTVGIPITAGSISRTSRAVVISIMFKITRKTNASVGKAG